MNVLDARFSDVANDGWLQPLDASRKPISTVGQAERAATMVAPGVYFVRNVGGYNTLFADAGDCVAVADGTWSIPQIGPPASAAVHSDLAQQVVDLVRQTLPGKKICYVIPGHHHSDHFAGIGTFAKAGATVITSPGNSLLARRLAGRDAKIEIVNDRLEVGSGRARMEIYLLKGGSHAGEMLFTYFPEYHIVFEADISDYVLTAKQFLKYVASRGLKVDSVYGVHSRNPFPLASMEDDEPAN